MFMMMSIPPAEWRKEFEPEIVRDNGVDIKLTLGKKTTATTASTTEWRVRPTSGWRRPSSSSARISSSHKVLSRAVSGLQETAAAAAAAPVRPDCRLKSLFTVSRHFCFSFSFFLLFSHPMLRLRQHGESGHVRDVPGQRVERQQGVRRGRLLLHEQDGHLSRGGTET